MVDNQAQLLWWCQAWIGAYLKLWSRSAGASRVLVCNASMKSQPASCSSQPSWGWYASVHSDRRLPVPRTSSFGSAMYVTIILQWHGLILLITHKCRKTIEMVDISKQWAWSHAGVLAIILVFTLCQSLEWSTTQLSGMQSQGLLICIWSYMRCSLQGC